MTIYIRDISSAIEWDHLTALAPCFYISKAGLSAANTYRPKKWTYHFKASEQEQNHVSDVEFHILRSHLILCGMSDFYSVSSMCAILSKIPNQTLQVNCYSAIADVQQREKDHSGRHSGLATLKLGQKFLYKVVHIQSWIFPG